MVEKSFVPTAGTAFCGYTLIAPVGKGGMGAVWTASNPGGVLVAVKFMLDTAAQQTEMRARERFAREAEVLHGATHDPDEPGKRAPWASERLVPVLDSFIIEGPEVGCIVMPVIPGHSLQAIFKGTTPYSLSSLSTRDKLTIILHIADALTAVHGAGYMHRDVKPLNVMVYINPRTLEVTAWLLDCGIALPIKHGAADRLSGVGNVMGSERYLPPEYIRSNAETCLPEGDVFSLAVLAYMLFSGGKHPYNITGEDDNTTIVMNIYGGKRAPSAIGHINPAIQALIEAGLKDDWRKRANVSEIIRAIGAQLRDHELSFDAPMVPAAASEPEPAEEPAAHAPRLTAPPSLAIAPPPLPFQPAFSPVHQASDRPPWKILIAVFSAVAIVSLVIALILARLNSQPRSQIVPTAATVMVAGAPPPPVPSVKTAKTPTPASSAAHR